MIRQFSAGGLVYKRVKEPESGKVEVIWLVRRPVMNPGYKGNPGWSWPKGWIDKGETTEGAALREVAEEGGVRARVVAKLPTIKIFFVDKGERVMKFITYFVMEYEGDIPGGHDQETEEIKWVSEDEAFGMLAFANEKKLLKLARKNI